MLPSRERMPLEGSLKRAWILRAVVGLVALRSR
jgi:hypothetical protein